MTYNAAALRLLASVLLLLLAQRLPADGEEEEATRDGICFITWISVAYFLVDLLLDLHHKGVL